jgi:GT2 family glycosyltransferase
MIAGVIVTVLGTPLAAASLYQVTLAAAALRYRPGAPGGKELRIAVVVPAHDEETVVAACIESLLACDYPAALREVVVVADNCTDGTASVAARAGARVLVRNDPTARGKGYALRFAFDALLTDPQPADAFAVVDADSTADRAFLRALVRPLADGAGAAQGESLLIDDGTPRTAFRAAAFLLINRARPAGRSALGAAIRLAGNGMAFRRDVLEAHPWNAFSSTEDVEYSLRLRTGGVPIAFAGGAVLTSPMAPSADAAVEQQLRWEGGKLHLMRTWLPKLFGRALRERRGDLLDEALELSVPPLGLFVAAAGAGDAVVAVLVGFGLLPVWSLVPWLVALVGIPVYVLVGLRAANAPASAYSAMVRAPIFVLGKFRHIRRFLTFRGDTWVRTEREKQ